MPPFTREFGKVLLLAGGILVLIGLFLYFGQHLPFLGDLPGDFHFKRGQFDFYFPLGSALVVSLGLTLLVNLILWLIS